MKIDDSNKKNDELNQKIEDLKKRLVQKDVEMKNYKMEQEVLKIQALMENTLECKRKEKGILIQKEIEIKTNFLEKEKKEIQFLKNALCKDPSMLKELKNFIERKEELFKNMELEIGCLKSILNKNN